MKEKILVLGAGPSGLSAAYHLGSDCEVFEKEADLGGHCRTRKVNGFYFDEGAHVFFGKGACADQFVWEPLGAALPLQKAEIWNNYGGRRFGRYPVQVNAHALPPELATRCVRDFIEAERQPEREVRTYEDWCYASFGKSFADNFMLHYARKVWTVEPSELTTEWLGSKVGGRISRPSLEQVLRGAIDPEPTELNYLTEFAYPIRGGFERILQPLSEQVRHVHRGCGVQRIESQRRQITFSNGQMRAYDVAVSTLPLPTLVRLTVDAPAEVRQAAARLMWTSLRCVNLGIRRPDVGRGHWIYFYDHDVPFFRISFPARLAPSTVPDGYSAISCEIAYSRRKPLREEGLLERVLESLRTTGILHPEDEIVLVDQVDVPYSYVVFDFQRSRSLEIIHGWMRSVGLYPCGRFGEWGYHWSFEAIESGQRVARQVQDSVSKSVA